MKLHHASFVASLALAGGAFAGTPFVATGDAAEILPAVDAFRALLGTLNPNQPGSLGTGRREINWDGAPDEVSSPNVFPPDFFNGTTPGRARGALFTTDGTHFEVSAKDGNPAASPLDFGNIDPSYVAEFEAFTPQRLFTPVGSVVTEVTFFVPGTVTLPAAVKGFGVVFSDVDIENGTYVQFLDADDNVLGEVTAPATIGQETFSFAGMAFTGPERVAKVVIVAGTLPPLAGHVDNPIDGQDVVVMDDLIYGEPINLNCPTDFNGDNITDGADLGQVLALWGASETANPIDLDGDGLISGYDIGQLLAAFGPCN